MNALGVANGILQQPSESGLNRDNVGVKVMGVKVLVCMMCYVARYAVNWFDSSASTNFKYVEVEVWVSC